MSLFLRRSVIFAGLFAMFTVVGTLSHEMGHIVVANSLGYQTTLHYRSMNWHSGPLDSQLTEIQTKYGTEIVKGLDFPLKDEYDRLESSSQNHVFEIITGGPYQTMVTGIIGLIFLLIRRTKQFPSFKWFDWLAVFMSMFWLREIFTLIVPVAKSLLGVEYNSGDEFLLSRMLRLNEWTFPTILGILGAGIIGFVVFKVIPLPDRSTFIVGGCFGGVAGYLIWMEFLGPILLP